MTNQYVINVSKTFGGLTFPHEVGAYTASFIDWEDGSRKIVGIFKTAAQAFRAAEKAIANIEAAKATVASIVTSISK